MEGSYDFNQKERGIALLIHNEYFLKSSGYQNRPGDDRDYKRMKKIFKTMGFKVCSFRDKTKREMLEIADEVAGMEEKHRGSDCFVCVVASHGLESQKDTDVHSRSHEREHVIVGVDGKEMSTSDFVEKFDGENCEGLQGKPKFFFIQACRIGRYRGSDEGMDKGLEIGITKEENMKKKKKTKKKGKHMVDGSVQEPDTSEKQDSEDETFDESDDSVDDEEDIVTSDTDDDEDFAEFRAKFQEIDADLSKESHPKQRLELEKRLRRKQIEELDAKGLMPDEDSVKVSVGSGFSKIDVPANAKTDQQIVSVDKTKPSAYEESSLQLDDKKLVRKNDSKLSTEEVDAKGYKPSERRVEYVVPMVTVVPCPDDTLIMFASTSGKCDDPKSPDYVPSLKMGYGNCDVNAVSSSKSVDRYKRAVKRTADQKERECRMQLDLLMTADGKENDHLPLQDLDCNVDMEDKNGNFAVRSPAAGSWLLNKLYQQLKVYTKDPGSFQNINFLNILTEVLTCMSLETYSPGEKSHTKYLEGRFSPGCITHCLTEQVFFTEKPSKRKFSFLKLFKR